MNHADALRKILSSQLGSAYPPTYFRNETELLGHVPELDSMAVVGVLTAIEDEMGIIIGDDEISADAFATFGSLLEFVQAKVPG